MQKRYKLLVADIDGTLLDGRGEVSKEDAVALSEAREAGVRVSLCSGRAGKACLSLIECLRLDSYHIFFDGALVSTPGMEEEVYACPIQPDVVKRMVESARSLDVDLELYTPFNYFAERETWSTKAHREFFGIDPSFIDFGGIWERERIIKGLIAITNPEEQAKADAYRQKLCNSLLFSQARTPAYPAATFINIIAPGTSKGKALEALAAYLRIPLAEVAAIGDGTNDIPLLSTAGLAIAMGNAPSEVKSIADYVTLDVQHGGVAAAIRKFLL